MATRDRATLTRKTVVVDSNGTRHYEHQTYVTLTLCGAFWEYIAATLEVPETVTCKKCLALVSA